MTRTNPLTDAAANLTVDSPADRRADRLTDQRADRRITKTKSALKKEFFLLLNENKLITNISVKTLCDKADVSRGTFYLHYSDLYDLLEELENELLSDFERILESHDPLSLKGSLIPILDDIVLFIHKNKDVCLMFFDADMSFTYKIKRLVRSRCYNAWSRLYDDLDRNIWEYLSTFIFSGCLDVITMWIKESRGESPDEITKLLEKIIMRGVGMLGSAQ